MLHKKDKKSKKSTRGITGGKGGKGARSVKDIWGTRERGGLFGSKHYWILSQFLGDYTREVYGRELVGKVPMSQKGVALALRDLEEMAILRARQRGRQVLYKLNHEITEIQDVLAVTEFMRKMEFLSEQRKLAHMFKNDGRIVGIFGSYAKGTETSGSDVDVFVIGKKKEEDYDETGKILGVSVHLFHFSPKEFRMLLEQKNPLWRSIVEDHVLLFGIEYFIGTVWKEYYGFHKVVP